MIFSEIDLRNFDAWAIVEPCSGVAVIEPERRDACRAWLVQRGYTISSHDCRDGLEEMIPSLEGPLRWRAEFGYALKGGNRNLDALNDGFRNLDVPAEGGLVLEFVSAETAWREDPEWFLGLLRIASNHSRYHLALGNRFFVLLVVSKNSPLIGQTYGELELPVPFWSPSRQIHDFEA